MNDHKQETNNGRDTETGRFLSGNIGGGRPKGSRNRLTEQFISDLCQEWEKSGPAALEEIAKSSPVDFVRVVAALVPHRVDATMALIDSELLKEARTFAEAYRIARQVIGIDIESQPLIEAQNEAQSPSLSQRRLPTKN
jgi:hypothetical protein